MHRIIIENSALREIDAFLEWLSPLSPDAAFRQNSALIDVFQRELRYHPKLFSYFWITGPPYRARLFPVSRRTKFWIVYKVDDLEQSVNIIRFWNASANPADFEV
jgi:hypothetical protein